MEKIGNYLFAISPGVVAGGKIIALFALAGFLVLAFLAIPTIRRNTENKALKKTLARSRVGAISFGIGLFFLGWMRLEEIPFLSMRIWVALTILGFFVWLFFKIRFFVKTKKRIESAERRRLGK